MGSETIAFLDVLSALQAIQVCAWLGIRYQGVIELARVRGDFGIKGFSRVGRVSEVRFDISPMISILQVWSASVR